ncbi:hypothetical protein [uncultured Tyzzerella sp.]|uniref:hypothetical protein n=1 Tax=uncultured Tyzzerella sp. TaxID=2321398 RepID=UPI002943DCC8|nr:hypothetical protein [uncultured Tyzzerella sp.]
MDNIEEIKKRIEKAENLPKETREQFLFDYLNLKSIEAKNNNSDYVLWSLFCNIVCFAEDKNIISKDNLIKFIGRFEEEYKAKKEFNLDLLLQFISYILDK